MVGLLDVGSSREALLGLLEFVLLVGDEACERLAEASDAVQQRLGTLRDSLICRYLWSQPGSNR